LTGGRLRRRGELGQEVGETVRFLPEHCMMQNVHSGVVVHFKGNAERIEGIDLKVLQRKSGILAT